MPTNLNSCYVNSLCQIVHRVITNKSPREILANIFDGGYKKREKIINLNIITRSQYFHSTIQLKLLSIQSFLFLKLQTIINLCT